MTEQSLPMPAVDDPQRRQWLLAASAAGGAGAVATAVPFVASLGPSERAKAMGAAVEIDISDLMPGDTKTVEWRGKPVWISRRTPEQLAQLRGQDAALVDPTSRVAAQQPAYAQNETRSIKPEIFIAIGICTHLGCSPTPIPAGSANPSVGADWQGGYFCPCHGSKFDGAGRVFKNMPAPTNLEIPPHRYVSETRVLIGEDAAA